MLLALLGACLARPGATPASESASLAGDTDEAGAVLFEGGEVVGLGRADVLARDGVIVAVGADLDAAGATSVDVSGRWLVPAFIDSHVHLAYLPAEEELADNGVAGVVDLAAPMSFLAADHPSLRVLASGPMVTASGGYPTQGWGAGGYGLEVANAAEAEAAVDMLKDAGAGVIKLPVTSPPQLDADVLAAAAARAHARGLRVASHALDDDEAAVAAAAGADVLAHTPTGSLSASTIAAWKGKTVISTLAAFGGSDRTIGNLAALHAAGARVLYGTDFGNRRTAGIDASELALMGLAGMSPGEILASGTRDPADYWGFADLGAIEVGRSASLLVLDRDPLLDPLALAEPTEVWSRGRRRR